jgi:hypothetical protein
MHSLGAVPVGLPELSPASRHAVRLGVLDCFEAGAGRKVSERQIVVSLTRKPRDHMHVWLWPACMPDPPRHVSADRFETPGLST